MPSIAVLAARAAPNNAEITYELPSQTELLLLWVIQSAGRNGIYGLDIQRTISEASEGHESISVGSLYSLLKRLRERGYVDSREGEALGGGAKRRYYFLTDSGRSLMAFVNNFISRLQSGC